jgi:hypothetical protein
MYALNQGVNSHANFHDERRLRADERTGSRVKITLFQFYFADALNSGIIGSDWMNQL